MPPPSRRPYDHALHLINHTNEAVNSAIRTPDGRHRDMDATAMSGTLNALSNLAIASALLAVADAIKSKQIAEGHQ